MKNYTLELENIKHGGKCNHCKKPIDFDLPFVVFPDTGLLPNIILYHGDCYEERMIQYHEGKR